MNKKHCQHCKDIAEISLCKKCYSDISCKAAWNQQSSSNERIDSQYLEIVGMIYDLSSKVDKLDMNLDLIRKLEKLSKKKT